MKKLYIPTSTLNFNNILASESISPFAFYSRRNFGYKTFEVVKPNCLYNSILLYDKFPIFEIDDTERDNYPMIIEIECSQDDVQHIITLDEVSIYQSIETIYLNPFSSKIFFLSEQAKKITLIGSERSLSTKLVYLYEQCGNLSIKDKSITSFQFEENCLTEIVNDIANENLSQFIDIDQRKNRAKGFMYSYLLGANKSLNKELVTIKKCAREITNIVSAILHSPDKSITTPQKNSLSKISNEFSRAYERIDDDAIKLNNLIKEIIKKTDNTIDKAKNLIEQLGFSWEDALNNIANQNNLRKPLNIDRELKYNFENVSNVLNDVVLRKESSYLSEKIKFDITDKIILANLRLTVLIEEKTDFYTALINEFLSIDSQSEVKIDIAIKGITIFKELLKENNRNWEDSLQRSYFNELLANLQGRGSFDVLKDDNIIRQSFALFVLYKDDIEKIESSLVTNLIPEYRFAFGLWGAMFGFANMPKTITNDLFLADDLNYLSEMYKYVHKQVHGVELEGRLERKKVEKTILIPSKINDTPTSKGIKKDSITGDSNTTSLGFYERLIGNNKSIKSDKRIYIKHIEDYGVTEQLLDAIKGDKRLNKGKGAPKKVILFIGKEINSMKEQSNSRKQLPKEPIFQFDQPYQSSRKFLGDFDYLSNNHDFIKIVSKSNDWERDLKWFIDSHEKSHKDYNKYWKGKPIDNESVIKRYIFFSNEKYKDSETLLRRLYLSNE